MKVYTAMSRRAHLGGEPRQRQSGEPEWAARDIGAPSMPPSLPGRIWSGTGREGGHGKRKSMS